MENKITMPRLAAMLALQTGKQKKVCEDFLREIFAIVTEELAAGESIRIKGFGTFKIVEVEARRSVNVATGAEHTIPPHGKVLFVASKELAEKVNAPFDAFEAVEISDSLPTDMLDALDDRQGAVSDMEDECSEETEVADGELLDASVAESVDDEATAEAYEDVEDEGIQNEAKVSDPHPAAEEVEDSDKQESETQPESESQEVYYEDDEEEESQRGGRFGIGFLYGFLTALLICGIGICVGYYLGFTVHKDNEDKFVSADVPGIVPAVESSDSIVHEEDSTDVISSPDAASTQGEDDVPTKQSDSPVYDTVSTTRYLTTIAKEHYGNFNLWPIIYEENAKILGHPDRIKPGTKVVVPPLSKYGVDPENKDQIKAIKQKGVEIYARFK